MIMSVKIICTEYNRLECNCDFNKLIFFLHLIFKILKVIVVVYQ